MNSDLFINILKEAEKKNIGIVFTGGGEPTLHPLFKEILSLAINSNKKQLIPRIGLISNGGLDFSNIEWYLKNTEWFWENSNIYSTWVRISVNYWNIHPKLKELLKQYPNRIGLSIIYNEYDYQQTNAAKFNYEYLNENFKPKLIRMKPCHDFGHPTINPLDCQARKFVKIYETDGSEPYCCLSRGMKRLPPKICPSGCPWNVKTEDAWIYDPFS
jgi:hypothetical protein